MEQTNPKYAAYIQILREELVPAMGCTEPIAIAYGAAKGREVLGGLPDQITVEASGNIIKNVKSVVVPNTGGLRGIEAAAAAGAAAGKPELLLEVISQVTPEQQEEIRTYLREHPVRVEFWDSGLVFDIRITLRCGEDTARVRIANYHTNIVHIERNGNVLLDLPVEADSENGLTDRSLLTMADIYDFAQTVDLDDVREIIRRQIEYNMAISREGLTHSYGAGIGRVIRSGARPDDLFARARSAAAAGSDARMGGCELPVIINSGSGNQGMTASVPVIVYGRDTGVSEDRLYRALVLSNLITIHQKTRIGRLSAYCGAVSAGAAAGAGIAYLDGGGYDGVTQTVVNALAIVSGMVCDGAKASCAGKIAAAIDAGVLGYLMYRNGRQFHGGDGILSSTAEATLDNVGRLGRVGMASTDKEILKIMLGQ